MEKDNKHKFENLTRYELEKARTSLVSDIDFWGKLRPTIATFTIGLMIASCTTSAITYASTNDIDPSVSLGCLLGPAAVGITLIKIISNKVEGWRKELKNVNGEISNRNHTVRGMEK